MSTYTKDQLAESKQYLDRMRTHGKYFTYAFYTLLLLAVLTILAISYLDDGPWLLLPTAVLGPVIIGLTIKGAGRIGASWWLSMLSMFIPIGASLWAVIAITSIPDVESFFQGLGETGTGIIIAAGVLIILALALIWFFASIHLFDRLLGVKRAGRSFWHI